MPAKRVSGDKIMTPNSTDTAKRTALARHGGGLCDGGASLPAAECGRISANVTTIEESLAHVLLWNIRQGHARPRPASLVRMEPIGHE
ncbi:hypothetical protein CLCR_02188 [Cladophialophora carrionii]|uniref:Uncharacterized protein n=1 Tax=Cladophialophora carrionii TaxID=86049 RepID=A0A1C1CDE3_9EURO|nr:hypothetical protein CLCR_02188 [Cladophialophora carrionii]